jgi:hypothetical protein
MKAYAQNQPSEKSRPQAATPLELVLDAVEIERGNLARAESLLTCLKIALEYGEDAGETPYFPDVAEMGVQMLRQSISALDSVNLPKAAVGKVREEAIVMRVVPLEIVEPQALLSSSSDRTDRNEPLHLHRRDYSSRPAMCVASNQAPACDDQSS